MSTQTQQADRLLDRCRRQVEEQLQWGGSEGWRNQDFAALSEKILDSTGVLLSVTTLKRLWGRLPYGSTPNANTLNALAVFIGHENWQAFRAEEEGSPERPAPPALPSRARPRWALLLVLPAAVLIVLLFIRSEQPPFSPAESAKITFTSRPVAGGVPNTVVFHYDVSHLKATDVQLQQTWDSTRRVALDPTRHEVTSTYYYPGYWRARLLVDGRVARTHDLFIRSGGWLATLGRNERPRYFAASELRGGDTLALSDSMLTTLYATGPPTG